MIIILNIISFTFLIYILYYLSSFLNLIDKPNSRKKHIGNIPLIGGLAIYLNVLIYSFFYDMSYNFSIILYTSSILLILGAIDDSKELGVSFRLVAQLASCLIIIGSGLMIKDIGDYWLLPNIKIGLLSIIFTVFCVIGLTNSFNFIDGIDGLCAGLVLISLVSIFLFALIENKIENFYDYKIILLLSISILCFLVFNLTNFSKVFLGDSGSMTLGFFLSWILILITQSEQPVLHPVLTLWCVTIPVFDLTTVVIRRILRGINPFRPDRRHVHHILIKLGLSNRTTLIIILFLSLILNYLGFIIFYNLGPFPALLSFTILLLFYLFIMISISRFIYKN